MKTTGHKVHKNLIMEYCKDEGRTLRELSDLIGRPSTVTMSIITAYKDSGDMFVGGVRRKFLYFASAEMRDAYNHKLEIEALAAKQAKRPEETPEQKAKRQAEQYKARLARQAATRKAERAKRRAIEDKWLTPKVSGLVLRSQTPDDKRQHLAANVVWPSNVKVHVIPHGVDTRFKFTPPANWEGEFSKDFKAKRA